MQTGSALRPDAAVILRLVLALTLVFACAKAVSVAMPMEQLALSANDDIMRMLSVRDHLNGRDWYDKIQTRVVPPEGLEMHWSKILDATIAGLIATASVFMPLDSAEALAVVVWPLILFIVLAFIIAFMGQRLLGAPAAAVALLALALWPMFERYFGPARLDHHGIQIVLCTVMILLVASPTLPLGRFVLLGAAVAASLSIGLETLPVIALAALFLAARAIRDVVHAPRNLCIFMVSATCTSAVLLAIETPPHHWRGNTCDTLNADLVALLAVGTAVSCVYVALAKRLPSIWSRFLFLFGLGGVALTLTAGLWMPCLSGPYGALPEDAQKLIAERIQEARPALSLSFETVAVVLAPSLGAALVATAVLAVRSATASATDHERHVVGTLLVFAWTTLALSGLYQMRLIVLSLPATPLLAGYALASLWRMRQGTHQTGVSVALLAGSAMIFLSPSAHKIVPVAFAGEPPREVAIDPVRTGSIWACKAPDAIVPLEVLPRGRVLVDSNLGAPLLLLTDHDVLAVPYHRNATALMNGIAFEQDADHLWSRIAETRADYLVLCRHLTYGSADSFGTFLAAGGDAPGLRQIQSVDTALIAFEVLNR